MTEQEWLQATDPQSMLTFCWEKASKRKQRLLAVGFCRHTWDLLSEWGRRAVEVAERFADGQATDQELREARDIADTSSCEEDGLHQQAELERCLRRSPEDEEPFLRELDHYRDRLHAAMLAHTSTFPDEWLNRRELPSGGLWKNTAGLVRCLFGNPSRSLTIDSAWLSWHNGLLVLMARQIYDSRDFRDMPVLADALEEAGCTNPDILDHCRSGGEHVRGCWVIDALLGKS
jgi:hypothetical protein